MSAIGASPKSRLAPAVLLLTLMAIVLFAFGWIAGKASWPLGWMLAAVRVGWHDARGEDLHR